MVLGNGEFLDARGAERFESGQRGAGKRKSLRRGVIREDRYSPQQILRSDVVVHASNALVRLGGTERAKTELVVSRVGQGNELGHQVGGNGIEGSGSNIAEIRI